MFYSVLKTIKRHFSAVKKTVMLKTAMWER